MFVRNTVIENIFFTHHGFDCLIWILNSEWKILARFACRYLWKLLCIFRSIRSSMRASSNSSMDPNKVVSEDTWRGGQEEPSMRSWRGSLTIGIPSRNTTFFFNTSPIFNVIKIYQNLHWKIYLGVFTYLYYSIMGKI